MNELVLIFTREQLLNILTNLEVKQEKTGTPHTFRVTVPAYPDGIGVEWGTVTFDIQPEEQKPVVDMPRIMQAAKCAAGWETPKNYSTTPLEQWVSDSPAMCCVCGSNISRKQCAGCKALFCDS